MHKKCYIFLVSLQFVFLATMGQVKQEREYRIEASEVPELARQFIDSIGGTPCVRWYYEENLEGNSIEGKLRYYKKKHSIEFSTEGQLQDVEILIDFDALPERLQEAIKKQLGKEFDNFKVKKVQRQYTGERPALLELTKTGNTSLPYTTRYELVVKGKKDSQKNLYEITVDQQGNILKNEEILFRNTDNLEY
ncbi:hypothetical protein AB9P05_07600 [Roseivirga sp. BDSF3-8]|uniref:hypothetical protein n=1 Tax=Roseivirga sp. BDSF3-8 TaxID=3241598 RepID=UPI003531EDA7